MELLGPTQFCAAPPPLGPSVVDSAVCPGVLPFMQLVELALRRSARLAGSCAAPTAPAAAPATRAAPAAAPATRAAPAAARRTARHYDFVVVGAGTAGSIVASRLAEDMRFTVLLLEAGGAAAAAARAPGFYRAFWENPAADWGYRTQPAPYCRAVGGRCRWYRGKALGGTSVLNGMMYHRGRPADYDAWAAAAARADAGAGAGAGASWSWADVLPYFLRSEDNRQLGSVADPRYHAQGGPMPIQQFPHQSGLLRDVLRAAAAAGLPAARDLQDPREPEGLSVAQMFSRDGQRYTTYRAYLEDGRWRPGLRVLPRARVTRLVLRGGRARGVRYLHAGRLHTAYANKEVILCAGSLNTPQILMLSGIGPRDTLERLNIPVVADLPVGRNMRNHYGVRLYFLLTKMVNTRTLDFPALVQYLEDFSGPMSSTGVTQVGSALYSRFGRRDLGQTDLQLFFNSRWAECSRTGRRAEPAGGAVPLTINAIALRPKSVGYLTLNSSDPLDPPLFYPNYFSHPDDMRMLEDAAEYVRRIVDTKILKDKYGIALDPAYGLCSAAGAAWSAAWVRCAARTYTDPQNHQAGTAAVGRVLDSRLRVFNVTGLRVMDASAFPELTSGNPQAPVMMVAERGADFLKEQWTHF